MRKVKIFSTSNWKMLEKEINAWLSVSPKVFINEFKFQFQHTAVNSEFIAIVLYYEKA